MPPRIQIDEPALLKAIADGLPQKEILSRFGLKSLNQLKLAYLNALCQAGKVTALKAGRTSKANEADDTTVTVNKRGSLIIPKALVTQLGLAAGGHLRCHQNLRRRLPLQSTSTEPVRHSATAGGSPSFLLAPTARGFGFMPGLNKPRP